MHRNEQADVAVPVDVISTYADLKAEHFSAVCREYEDVMANLKQRRRDAASPARDHPASVRRLHGEPSVSGNALQIIFGSCIDTNADKAPLK